MPAISPAINPQVIVGERPRSTQSFQNFISGGSPLGSSVVSNAANKIVGFERAAVKPVVPDINSIVNTISSNILNQVDNSIRNATNIINQTTDTKIQQAESGVLAEVQQLRSENQNNYVTELQNVVQRIQNQTTNIVERISEDYKKRVNEVNSARPNNLLTNFIQLYRTAIDFIKFFGDRRNIDTLRTNLVALRESFTESFEVAKLIRTTIVKIFNQLSSLPKAGPGSSSGLNIDVNVPQAGMKKTLPKGARGMKGKLGMLALGLGGLAAGGAAVNALAGSREQVQAAPSEQSIPGQILDTFSVLISRFANAVDEMVRGGDRAQSGSTGSSAGSKSGQKGGGGQRGGGKSPGGLQSGGKVDTSKISGDTPEQKAFLATVGSTEAGTYNTIVGGQQIPELTKMTIQEVYDMGMKSPIMSGKLPDRFGGRTIKYGADSHAMGRYQFIPDTMMSAMRSAGLKPTDLYNPENQDKMALAFATKIGIDVNRPMTESDYRKAGSSVAWEGMRKISYAEAKKRYDQYLLQIKPNTKEKPGVGGEDLPEFMLSPQKKEELKLATQTVSQPPPSQTEAPTITTLPLDLSGGAGGGNQQAASGPIPAPTRSGAPGPQAPYIPSSDPENFLVLYSKIVYNIVDG